MVLSTFWLRNVLRATTACNCSSLICPAGSAPAALASLLFDPPGPQIIGKTQCFATFLPFRAPRSSFFWDFLFLIFFLLLFSSLLWLLPPLLFICPYCRKFDFETSFDYICIQYVHMQSAHTALAVKACLLGGNSNTKCSMTFVNIAVAISALAGGGAQKRFRTEPKFRTETKIRRLCWKHLQRQLFTIFSAPPSKNCGKTHVF